MISEMKSKNNSNSIAFSSLFIILIFISCSTTNQEVSLDYSKKSPKELLRLSVEGVPEAQTALGTLHYHGRGVPQDFKEAVRWYRIAADQKLVEAQFNLGLMYYHGRGVQQDYKRAIRWIRFCLLYTSPSPRDRG